MNDDELKNLWQQQPLRAPDFSPAQVMSAIQNKTTLYAAAWMRAISANYWPARLRSLFLDFSISRSIASRSRVWAT
jgi:hypothetical protein